MTKKKKYSLDFSVVKRQIMINYLKRYKTDRPKETWSLRACIDLFRTYYTMYFSHFGIEHPRLGDDSIYNILDVVEEAFDADSGAQVNLEPQDYPPLIDHYFNTEFSGDCDHSIAHFMSGKIRMLAYLECLY